jgi:hypothetical protein
MYMYMGTLFHFNYNTIMHTRAATCEHCARQLGQLSSTCAQPQPFPKRAMGDQSFGNLGGGSKSVWMIY